MNSNPSNNVTGAQPLPVIEDDRDLTRNRNQRAQLIINADDGNNNNDEAANTGPTDQMKAYNYLIRFPSLDRALESPHITGIAISGTIGIGLFVKTGEVISLTGGLGAIIAYTVGGLMVICVMLCLSEMVAFRHEAGAIFEYPKLFVSHALGFAVGMTYWLAYTTTMVTLIVSSADLLALDPGGTAGVTAGIIIVISIANLLGGVKLYGTLEWLFKWYKLFLIVILWIIMIYVNRSEGIDFQYWQTSYLFPPGFNGNLYPNVTDPSLSSTTANNSALWVGNATYDGLNMEIPGIGGTLLGILTGVNISIFSFIGVEILIVAAGEAKNARRDLPRATNWIYLVTIGLYFISTLIVSFNVGYDDPELAPYDDTSGITSAYSSPFIIAMRRSALSDQFVTAFKWCFFLSAVTTANTNIYVASRTLFALASNSNVHWVKKWLGRTSQGKTPLVAIGVSMLPALLALTGIFYGNGYGDPTRVVNVFTDIGTTSFLCVYVAECWTFIQFMNGLKAVRDRVAYITVYRRIPRQPFYAWCGLISGSFFILFNGWHIIPDAITAAADHEFLVSDIFVGIIQSYFGPGIFVLLYLSYRVLNRVPREREENFWELRSKVPAEALSAIELQNFGRDVLFPEQNAAVVPADVSESRLRKIWLYT